MKRGYLVFENGQAFEGERFGAETDALGELVFTTGMTGYVETLTDRQLCGADCYADLPFNRKLWRHAGGL